MYKILRPIKDAYITDRYVNGASQTVSNVGAAGSLDLFKLYGYTQVPASPPAYYAQSGSYQFTGGSIVSFNGTSPSYYGNSIVISDTLSGSLVLVGTVIGGIVAGTIPVITGTAVFQGHDNKNYFMDNTNVPFSGTFTALTPYFFSSSYTYGQSVGTVNGTELSRLLVQFDLDPLRDLVTAGEVDPGNSSFSCVLRLSDVYGGQPTPDNFNVVVYPLSASFDEGLGKDVVFYSDSDTCNWLSGSIANGQWFITGCGLGGSSTSQCDYITASAFIANGASLESEQLFVDGAEDLSVDVTLIVSATLAGLLPDVGLRISFDTQTEANQYTYFVKRFASRTAYNEDKRPKLIVKYDDSIQDDTQNFYLDSTNYLFLYNYARSALTNLTSGSSQITGANCLQLSFTGEFPSVTPGVVSSSIVLEPSSPFAFIGSSNIAFSGIYTGSLNGSGSVSDLLLIGQLSGTIPSYTINVPSGSYFLSDGITLALSGVAFFTGSFQGLSGSDVYTLTGTYFPAPVDGPYIFSGTYESSSTLGPVPFTLGPFQASQLAFGVNEQVGIYSSSILISSTNPSLLPQWQMSGSVTVTPIWQSLDGTLPYLTGSAIKLYAPQRGTQSISPKRLVVSVYGIEDSIGHDEQTVLRVNIFDYTAPYVTNALRLPVELPGVIIRDVHYQVRNLGSGNLAIPFDLKTNSTRISNDSAGMYFKIDSSNLTKGNTYVIDILIVTGNNKQLYKSASPAFRVDVTP